MSTPTAAQALEILEREVEQIASSSRAPIAHIVSANRPAGLAHNSATTPSLSLVESEVRKLLDILSKTDVDLSEANVKLSGSETIAKINDADPKNAGLPLIQSLVSLLRECNLHANAISTGVNSLTVAIDG